MKNGPWPVAQPTVQLEDGSVVNLLEFFRIDASDVVKLAEMEADGWKIVGGTAYGAGDISLLLRREVKS
jgi:hypothetical protein